MMTGMTMKAVGIRSGHTRLVRVVSGRVAAVDRHHPIGVVAVEDFPVVVSSDEEVFRRVVPVEG